MIGLDVFLSEWMIFHGEFKPEGLVALGQGRGGEKIPEVRTVGFVRNFIEWIEIKIFVRGEKGNMGFLKSQGDKERLVAVIFILQPSYNLSGILAIFVLGIGQSASPFAWRRLGIQFRRYLFFDFLPFFIVGLLLDGPIFRFKF